MAYYFKTVRSVCILIYSCKMNTKHEKKEQKVKQEKKKKKGCFSYKTKSISMVQFLQCKPKM